MKNFKLWIKAAGIRALKTFAQTIIALVPVAVTINDVDWLVVLGTGLTSAILSLLTSISGLPEIKEK